jgi:carbon storage regulator
MLVLTRRLGESITIGEDVKIVIVDIDGNQVKIGIEAPRSVEVYREELYEKIKGHSFKGQKKDPAAAGHREAFAGKDKEK